MFFSPETHFVPIRSESMEKAYIPARNKLEEREWSVDEKGNVLSAVDFYGSERYFVLRPDAHVPGRHAQ